MMGYTYLAPFTVHMDSQKHRIYFIFQDFYKTCLCLDAGSWNELGTIENVFSYDDKNDRMYLYGVSKGFYYRHIPTLEELIGIGESLIK